MSPIPEAFERMVVKPMLYAHILRYINDVRAKCHTRESNSIKLLELCGELTIDNRDRHVTDRLDCLGIVV